MAEQHYATLRNGETYYVHSGLTADRFERGVERPVNSEVRARLENYAFDLVTTAAHEGDGQVNSERQKFTFRTETVADEAEAEEPSKTEETSKAGKGGKGAKG